VSAIRVVPRATDDAPHPAAVAPRSGPDVAALVAGVLTSGMALYHFTLPASFRWGEALDQVPTLRWGLSLINASFSFLLLAGGAMTIAIAFAPWPRERTSAWALGGMAAYWLFNIVWQLVDPMPLPRQLAALRLAFPAFSAVLVALYAAALLRPRARRAGFSAPSPRPAG
jgi:hypothetical protein